MRIVLALYSNMKYLLIALIILSGIFHYRGFFQTRFYPAQYGIFMFTVSILGSCLIWRKNKWLGYLAILFTFGFLKTYLGQDNFVLKYFYREVISGAFIFAFYYIIRELDLKENILKWFLIPVGLNILLLFAQKFDGNILSFMPVERATGFLGNPSVTSTYIALSAPIFLRYYPKLLPFLIIAVCLCSSRVPFIAMVVSGLIYLWYMNRKIFKLALWGTVIGIWLFLSYFTITNENYMKNWVFWFRERGSMIIGTLDGITHNPILGWGVGTFYPIISSISEKDSYYFGAYFNAKKDYDKNAPDPGIVMDHPHNEYIYGWWNVGILFPILIFLLMRDISKKFTRKNILPFSILVGGMVLGMGYFFCYPVWIFLIITLAVYDNQGVKYATQKEKKKISFNQ